MSTFNPIRTATLIASAAGILAVATPSFAAESHQTGAKIIKKNGQTLYCVTTKTTGSRIPEATCLTREEWAERGATIKPAKADAVLASTGEATNQN
jgi:hypothetical protein